jgi:hypothetical protein
VSFSAHLRTADGSVGDFRFRLRNFVLKFYFLMRIFVVRGKVSGILRAR